MNNKIQIFNNPEFGEIRYIIIDGEPWFVAADICRILNLSSTTKALLSLDDDEKSQIEENRITAHPEYYSGSTVTPFSAILNIVNEPGLYHLIFISRKPEAKNFRRKVFHEILPSIRKTGMYIANPELRKKIAAIKETEHWINEIGISKPMKKHYAEHAQFLLDELAEHALAIDEISKKDVELREDFFGNRINTPYYLRRFIAEHCIFDEFAHVPAKIFIDLLRKTFPQSSAADSNRTIINDVKCIKGLTYLKDPYGAYIYGIKFKIQTDTN